MELKKYIEEEIPETQTAAWKNGNNSCKLQISMHVNDETLLLLKDKEYAKEMWELLVRQYERKTSVSEMVLICKLTNIKKKNNKNLNEHLDRFVQLVCDCKNSGIDWNDDYWPCFLLGTLLSNYSIDCLTRKSTSGYIFKLFGSTVSWSTRKQNCVALSSTEVEYIALVETVKKAKI